MADAVEAYVRRLERELAQRRVEDEALLEEMRAHLLDAIADGRQRGLSLAEAECEAFERFGAPEIVAAHVLEERNRTMAGLTASLSTFWRLKWWILAPTVVAAVVTSVASHYLLPTRYRSEATMIVLAPREADDDGGRRMVTAARFQQISQQITSRTFLEQIVRDLHLDDGSRGQSPVSEIIEHMRQDIGVQFVGVPSEATTVRVSFLAEDPQTAKTVTERLISFALDEHQHDSVMTAKRADEFIEAQIEDLRRRLIDVEQNLEQLGARRGGRPLSQADVLPYEVLQERYRTLLVRREESRTAATAGQRRIGEQLRILDLPQVPDEPHGPSRLQANSAGTFLGLGLGVALAGVRRRSCRLG